MTVIETIKECRIDNGSKEYTLRLTRQSDLLSTGFVTVYCVEFGRLEEGSIFFPASTGKYSSRKSAQNAYRRLRKAFLL